MKRSREQVTQEELKELLRYDPMTGVFIWAKRRKGGRVGSVAGHLWKSKSGCEYRSIMIYGRNYLAHRLVFLHTTGEFPTREVDHINHNGLDNREANLREVTRLENGRNMPLTVRNSSGFVGVSYSKQRGKWESKIQVKGVTIHLGRFTEKEDAIKARKLANEKYKFHENHGKEKKK